METDNKHKELDSFDDISIPGVCKLLESDIADASPVKPPSISTHQPPRNQPFKWSRPPPVDPAILTSSARLAQAIAMEEYGRQREVTLRLVCRQLHKANNERFQLVQELDGYRGPARDELYQENLILRERLDRVTKENLRLRGIQMKEKINSSRKRRANKST